ncbi:MAG: amidohydrolase family protein [Deltaproteobacteria bacterium]|nr:amidohydrolase family protein [Deltaproteobacteria bacterium]
MSVIDIHIHVGKREHLTEIFLNYFRNEFGEPALQAMDDLTPAKFDKFLQLEGVDKGVLLSEYSPEVTGVVPNEFTVEFARSTDRLIPFGSININSSVDTGAQAEHALKDLGCKGLKLLPSYGYYYPNDSRMYDAYEVAQNRGAIVMFHTGTSLFPKTRVRYAHPLLLDDVAVDFPELRIVMCHGGRPFWYHESEWMLRRHPNLFIDISGIPPVQLPRNFPKLERFYDRFLFGSDWPNFISIRSQADQVRELPYNAEIIEAILWSNAARLLEISI